MVRGSATPVVKKMLIPGLIFFRTASGETTEDSQLAPGSFMRSKVSGSRKVKMPKPVRMNARRRDRWKEDVRAPERNQITLQVDWNGEDSTRTADYTSAFRKKSNETESRQGWHPGPPAVVKAAPGSGAQERSVMAPAVKPEGPDWRISAAGVIIAAAMTPARGRPSGVASI
jgi:hypothetical protein